MDGAMEMIGMKESTTPQADEQRLTLWRTKWK